MKDLVMKGQVVAPEQGGVMVFVLQIVFLMVAAAPHPVVGTGPSLKGLKNSSTYCFEEREMRAGKREKKREETDERDPSNFLLVAVLTLHGPGIQLSLPSKNGTMVEYSLMGVSLVEQNYRWEKKTF
ncbi:hypothetical protein Tco_1430311 [Tanacetum coccineum]